MVVSSQVKKSPLPSNLPFRIVSGTIGQGAYAFIRKACPLTAVKPVIAIKFIHKDHAYRSGRIKPQQIQKEIGLHQEVGYHRNIIQFLSAGEDHIWTWIAMELAEGDLFDKVEADEGVGEDIAHFYFRQLTSAVGYIHSKGVAHRDIKPENMLLSDGNLKVADFGLAALFKLGDQTKKCQTVCGSPPYMAPEVVPKGGFTGQKTLPYDPEMADIWSCGIVLFVLLVGNTPWDEPTRDSAEYIDYLENQPDELWSRVPLEVLSLLRGILRVDPAKRFTFADIRRHPWFTRPNSYLTADDQAADPLAQATQMLGKLRIDFSADPLASSQSQRAMETDRMEADTFSRMSLTQPDTSVAELAFDWEQPVRVTANDRISASQPTATRHVHSSARIEDRLMAEPALSQFSATQSIPISVTQAARRFRDIIPEHSLTRFFSFMDFPLLLPLLSEALARLAIPVSPVSQAAMRDGSVYIEIKTRDQRNCMLAGVARVEQLESGHLEVLFTKIKGDPLEWRRLFKKVVVLCKDALWRPELQ